ncbi:hypothetical protein [Erythrobacter sp. EC-HK427]|uniref:hypothetical protein n=1 Tax=Erythrobacter sp. EC-HK427 TaxID=2038396 RepID=UPI001255CD85|nr:hypothetical protein [Erythrobacter sp. EC-HK427]VVT13522.1 membrane hypothetical protein [Erythrobacter sp. EC-HK427]
MDIIVILLLGSVPLSIAILTLLKKSERFGQLAILWALLFNALVIPLSAFAFLLVRPIDGPGEALESILGMLLTLPMMFIGAIATLVADYFQRKDAGEDQL